MLLIALGYPNQKLEPPPKRPISEICYFEEWGQTIRTMRLIVQTKVERLSYWLATCLVVLIAYMMNPKDMDPSDCWIQFLELPGRQPRLSQMKWE